MTVALSVQPLPSAEQSTRISAVPDDRVSDGELLERVAGGDAAAFDTLYGRYARAVYGFALRRLGDRGRAEEAVQETFTAVWRSARSFRRERGPGGPWLYAVARNAIVDRFRSERGAAGDYDDSIAQEDGPDARAEAAWVSWRVHRALEELPEHERTVLELAYWSGLSQSEVAEFLNLPLGTVKTRTRSALGRLSGILDGEDVR